MRIVGHGVDIVEVERIAEMLARHGDRFLDRCYTAGERAYAEGSRRRVEHLAARFAAKEAVLKALGTGWRSGIAWTDVEVVPLASGRPTIRLHNRAAELAADLRIATWWVSISHARTYAVASAIATAATPDDADAGALMAD